MASHPSLQFGEEAEEPLPAQALKRDQRRHGGAFAGNILACVRRCASSERTIRYRIARGPDF